MQMVNIGFGNLISAAHLIAVISPDSAPSKRLVQNARDQEFLIDATHGKKTRSLMIMDSGHVVLSSFTTETIGSRLGAAEEVSEED